MTWPAPFSGITYALIFDSPEMILSFVTFVSKGCGHGHAHNIAVQFDGLRVHGTELLADCARKWHNTHWLEKV